MNTSKKSLSLLSFVSLLGLAMLTLSTTASAFDAAADFSATSNPNGAWTYGWSYGVAGTFHTDITNSLAFNSTPLSGWLGNEGGSFIPYVIHNGTAGAVTYVNSHYQPGQLGLQPGNSNEVAIVRWTASAPESINIATTFSGLSSLGDSVDVHVLHDGVSIFNSTVNGSPAPASFSGLQSVLTGDTIDFVVGNGDGVNPNEDNTGLAATIVVVPEPGTLGLVAMGFGCLLSLGLRKRK